MKTRGWRNRKTLQLEGLLSARTWRFKSSPAHYSRYRRRNRIFLMDFAQRSPLILSHVARFARL